MFEQRQSGLTGRQVMSADDIAFCTKSAADQDIAMPMRVERTAVNDPAYPNLVHLFVRRVCAAGP